MVNLTKRIGLILILLGLAAYFGTGMQSITALIPAFFGIAIFTSGWLARNEKWRKHLMHGALVIGLLGLIGSFSGIPKLFLFISSGDIARPAAAVTQAIMAVTCLVYLVFGVRSFIQARKSS